jgi:hypothetical protein
MKKRLTLMDVEVERLIRLVENPAENLNVELKSWIDPTSNEGREKIVRAALALRNRNGGYLVIGIDDKTRNVAAGEPADVRALWKEDEVQALVSCHASDPFSIEVRFALRDGVELPVIAVPSGVQTPVALKKPIGRYVVGAVFFRTLRSGGVVSTSLARANDWPDIMQICFDNRDANVASFIRRHLADVDLASLIQALGQPSEPDFSLEQRTLAVRQRGEERFNQERPTALPIRVDPDGGAFEVSMQIAPPLADRAADQELRRTLAASDPAYGGGALWYESPGMGPAGLPKQRDNAWEHLFVTAGLWDYFDFMRVEPTGGFYQHRLLDTDAAAHQRGAMLASRLSRGLRCRTCPSASPSVWLLPGG